MLLRLIVVFSFEGNPLGSYSTLEHLLLKLSLVSEIAPRCQYKQSTLVSDIDLEAAKKRRRQVFRTESSSAAESLQESVKASGGAGAEIIDDGAFIDVASSAAQSEGMQKGKTYWAKGTGYGHGVGESVWNIEQQRAQQAEKDRLQMVISVKFLF